MDNQELVQKVYEMVKKTVENMTENALGCETPGGGMTNTPAPKPRPLILTSGHGECCHPAMERLGGVCALQSDNLADLDAACCVIMYDLSIANMGKLAAGDVADGFTRLASLALLKGIPVYAVSEGVEILKYQQHGGAYYNLLYGHLTKLRQCGVTIVAERELEGLVGCASGEAAPGVEAACRRGPARADARMESVNAGAVLSKRVLTESDMRNALANGTFELIVGQKTIVTSLAAEFAAKKNMAITRKP